MQIAAFKDMLKKAKTCAPVRYHRGELAVQRQYMPEVNDIARFVRALYDLGYVKMYQKRDEDGVMGYYVVTCDRFRNSRGHEDGHFAEAERLIHAH
jgi:hypothetical protein